jgi:hypothetical protein
MIIIDAINLGMGISAILTALNWETGKTLFAADITFVPTGTL